MKSSIESHYSRYHPQNLLLQWHITERCNLRCEHCYQESYKSRELDFNQLLTILNQYQELLDQFRFDSHRNVQGHITITGGEPFVRSDFMNLLEIFATRRNKFSFAILTNGSLINKELAQRLAGLNPAFIQVSIEGNEVTHDSIRGQGNYRRTIEAVKNLVSNKIRTLISFTAHSDNFREFSHVAKLGRELGVSRVWADRMIPLGSGSGKKVLTPDETHEFFRIMHRSRLLARFLQLFALGRTEIAMHRALQHLVGGGRAYHCTAGDSLITVQPNGDLLPCRRMPVTVGNLLETPLEMLYRDSDLFQELRDQARISKGCEKCSFNKSCSGGLKCLSYAVKGDPFSADPGCWKGSKQLIARSRT